MGLTVLFIHYDDGNLGVTLECAHGATVLLQHDEVTPDVTEGFSTHRTLCSPTRCEQDAFCEVWESLSHFRERAPVILAESHSAYQRGAYRVLSAAMEQVPVVFPDCTCDPSISFEAYLTRAPVLRTDHDEDCGARGRFGWVGPPARA
jgi:hypothetical protein